ncbi:hypothetical protein lacNasYZ03_02420 [Lactobacillus nasalidis]|uniref:Surface layer protein A domain-containing protein n=1 Tax=Lactobacillus nasalidis TaxID=2797258 RepID=A0ABQ3W5D3_9LACO|nr:hypothetical protein [Lactobacillus nasalidis]GHV98366.1 hypothetical protein lacNasYZ01_15480 [Lactobacillus nasalidis]GHV99233.1 hypothetical protein lacNasYZ02_06630 [Lactobacillus nasalidis]GHW00555.1 hypothetical protein lacNasYZ03_02420 [Lactobacillus nasalidis]
MFKKLRNALLALTALLSFTALVATPSTVSAASSSKYTPKYINRQVVLQLNCNSYVYDRYGNRMPWFNGLYGPLGYLKKDSYVYTTRKRLERTNKDVRYFALFTKGRNIDKTNYGLFGKKYWLPYTKINGRYFYYIGYGAYIKARNVYSINGLQQYSNCEKAMIDETTYTFTFNSKTKKIKDLPKKYKKGDYVLIDGLRQFTDDDGFLWWDADQPYYARLKGTGHGATGTYILLSDLRDKDTDIFYWDVEEDEHPNYRINLIRINDLENYYKHLNEKKK